MNKSDAPNRIGTQGWEQFLAARKEILNRFDRAKEYANTHEVQTYHGIVAEEEFRSWLSNFLPKKYAVTSGYVISQGQKDDVKAPHFDVIIYDQLNSPILWIEDHSGLSKSGASQAIPAEHVLSVIEVKSQFSASTVTKSLEHLRDLEPLYSSIDTPDERYKKFLPINFTCSLVFIELIEKNENSKAALNNMIKGDIPRGYTGGIILRGENTQEDCSGKIDLMVGDSNIDSTIGSDKESLLGSPLSDSVDINGNYLNVMLNWSVANFSTFAFDKLAHLSGNYKPGWLSSFHGMSWMNPERNKDA